MHDDIDIRRLTAELEHIIRQINQERISSVTGAIHKNDFVNVAETVSWIRARYLNQVLELRNFTQDGRIDTAHIKQLSNLRRAYEEALEGYNALNHALQRGYIDLEEDS